MAGKQRQQELETWHLIRPQSGSREGLMSTIAQLPSSSYTVQDPSQGNGATHSG